MNDYNRSNYKSNDGRISIWLTIAAYVFVGCVMFYGLYTFQGLKMIETFYSLDELKQKLNELEETRCETYDIEYPIWKKRRELSYKLNRSWKNE